MFEFFGMHAATFSALKPVTSDISENCVHSLYISFKQGGTKKLSIQPFYCKGTLWSIYIGHGTHTVMQDLFFPTALCQTISYT